jgi:hypothetical protein
MSRYFPSWHKSFSMTNNLMTSAHGIVEDVDVFGSFVSPESLIGNCRRSARLVGLNG